MDLPAFVDSTLCSETFATEPLGLAGNDPTSSEGVGAVECGPSGNALTLDSDPNQGCGSTPWAPCGGDRRATYVDVSSIKPAPAPSNWTSTLRVGTNPLVDGANNTFAKGKAYTTSNGTVGYRHYMQLECSDGPDVSGQRIKVAQRASSTNAGCVDDYDDGSPVQNACDPPGFPCPDAKCDIKPTVRNRIRLFQDEMDWSSFGGALSTIFVRPQSPGTPLSLRGSMADLEDGYVRWERMMDVIPLDTPDATLGINTALHLWRSRACIPQADPSDPWLCEQQDDDRRFPDDEAVILPITANDSATDTREFFVQNSSGAISCYWKVNYVIHGMVEPNDTTWWFGGAAEVEGCDALLHGSCP